jgi:hypothetical protein
VTRRAPKLIPVVQRINRRVEKRGVRQINSPSTLSAPTNLARTNA